jgi:DNA-directed RNA polymerase specialized sigma24 family protein
MLDATRLFTEAAARIAYDAFDADFGAEGGLDAWISARIERAIEDCLQEDREHERMGAPLDEGAQAQYEFAARGLGIRIELARRACVVFNSMPDAQRAAVWALTVGGQSAEEHACRTGATPRQVREYVANAERVLAALGAGRDGSSGAEGGESLS